MGCSNETAGTDFCGGKACSTEDMARNSEVCGRGDSKERGIGRGRGGVEVVGDLSSSTGERSTEGRMDEGWMGTGIWLGECKRQKGRGMNEREGGRARAEGEATDRRRSR